MASVIGILRYGACWLLSIACAVLAIIAIPLDKKGRTFHAVARFWALLILRVCGVKVKVRGLEKVDLSKSYVYVSNHASALDIPAIIQGIPQQIRIVYKKELERIPIFGWGLKWGHYVGIDRRRGADALKSLENAAKKVATGASVLLYAEGTRTQDGKLQPFKRGAFSLAVKAGVPVVPLTVNGSYGIFPRRSFAVRPGTVELVLDAPVAIHDIGKKAELELMQHVGEAIKRNYVDQ